jgi:hypothetical protein
VEKERRLRAAHMFLNDQLEANSLLAFIGPCSVSMYDLAKEICNTQITGVLLRAETTSHVQSSISQVSIFLPFG